MKWSGQSSKHYGERILYHFLALRLANEHGQEPPTLDIYCVWRAVHSGSHARILIPTLFGGGGGTIFLPTLQMRKLMHRGAKLPEVPQGATDVFHSQQSSSKPLTPVLPASSFLSPAFAQRCTLTTQLIIPQVETEAWKALKNAQCPTAGLQPTALLLQFNADSAASLTTVNITASQLLRRGTGMKRRLWFGDHSAADKELKLSIHWKEEVNLAGGDTMKEEATALCNNLKVWERGVKSLGGNRMDRETPGDRGWKGRQGTA